MKLSSLCCLWWRHFTDNSAGLNTSFYVSRTRKDTVSETTDTHSKSPSHEEFSTKDGTPCSEVAQGVEAPAKVSLSPLTYLRKMDPWRSDPACELPTLNSECSCCPTEITWASANQERSSLADCSQTTDLLLPVSQDCKLSAANSDELDSVTPCFKRNISKRHMMRGGRRRFIRSYSTDSLETGGSMSCKLTLRWTVSAKLPCLVNLSRFNLSRLKLSRLKLTRQCSMALNVHSLTTSTIRL